MLCRSAQPNSLLSACDFLFTFLSWSSLSNASSFNCLFPSQIYSVFSVSFLPFVSEEDVPHPMSTADPLVYSGSLLSLLSGPASSFLSQPLHTPLKLAAFSCKRAQLSSLKKKNKKTKKRLATYSVLSLRFAFSLTFIAVIQKPGALLATPFC